LQHKQTGSKIFRTFKKSTEIIGFWAEPSTSMVNF